MSFSINGLLLKICDTLKFLNPFSPIHTISLFTQTVLEAEKSKDLCSIRHPSRFLPSEITKIVCLDYKLVNMKSCIEMMRICDREIATQYVNLFNACKSRNSSGPKK